MPLCSMKPLFLFLALLLATPLAAQPREATSIPAAETGFNNALRSYDARQYDEAYRGFIRAATEYGYNQRTTAAYLMAGKSLYADGKFAEAASAMTTLLRQYPESRYVAAARAVQNAATARLNEEAAIPETMDYGIVLPMSDQDLVFTQALFNGVRLAVDEHNAANPGAPIRMVFRDTEGNERGATAAVRSLSGAGVEVVIGPLYSEEALAAGAAAEAERVLLIAPLATDEKVAAGRRWVFQANPSFAQRAQRMAQYAIAQQPGRIGIVAQRGTLSETMANAFMDQVLQLGGEVEFVEMLPSAELWFRLPEVLAERVRQADALYLPVTGGDAPQYAAAALRGLDQLLVEEERSRMRVFGNAEWEQLEASRTRAGQYRTAFTNDFHPDTANPETQAFARRYTELAGVAPDRLAYAGYDITRFVLEQLGQRRSEESLPDLIRRAAPYAGLAHRIDFAGRSANQALFIERYAGGRAQVVE